MAIKFLGTPNYTPRYRTWITGRYYGGNAGALSTNAPGLNYLRFVPLWVPTSVTVDRLGIEVTTATASSVARVGLYTVDSNDLPSALLVEATSGSTLDCSTTGAKEATLSQALSPGLYYMSVVVQGATCTLRALTGGIPPVAATTFLGETGGAVSNNYYWTAQSGALPASVTTASLVAGALAPRVQVRAA